MSFIQYLDYVSGLAIHTATGVLIAGSAIVAGEAGGPTFTIYTSHVQDPEETVIAPPSDTRLELLAQLSVSGEESFEVAEAQFLDGYVGSANGIDATFDAPSTNSLIFEGPFDGLFATDGTDYAVLADNQGAGEGVTITFSEPVAAWWSYFTDIGDFADGVTVQITLNKTGGGTQGPYTLEPEWPATPGALTFWGFVDTGLNTYDSLVIRISDAAEAVGMDQMGMATFAQLA